MNTKPSITLRICRVFRNHITKNYALYRLHSFNITEILWINNHIYLQLIDNLLFGLESCHSLRMYKTTLNGHEIHGYELTAMIGQI